MAQMQELHHANTEASTAENSGGSAVDKKRPIGFLDLPAEIRNRIYYYADERAHRLLPDDFDAERYIPSIMRYAPGNPGPWPIDDYAKSSLKFLGLTEVCRKVRSEYNPIWKATAEFRIRYDDFNSFTKAFYKEEDPKARKGPSLLQISWERYVDPLELDLLPFLKFRLCRPETEVQFILHELALQTCPGWLWKACLEGDNCSDERASSLCRVHWATYTNWRASREIYHARRLASLGCILTHENERWKSEIRSGAVTEVIAEVSGAALDIGYCYTLKINFAQQGRSISRELLDTHQACEFLPDRPCTCLLEHGLKMGLEDIYYGGWDNIICLNFPCVVDGTCFEESRWIPPSR